MKAAKRKDQSRILLKKAPGILIVLFVVFHNLSGCGKSNSESSAEIGAIPVGKGPDALFLSPNESYLYVANVEDTFISVIDTRKDKVVQTIDGADYPWGFARLGGSNLVAVSGWDKGVDVIDFTQHKIVRRKRYEYHLGGITSPQDGKMIYLVGTEVNKAFKVNAATLEIVDEYPTGNGPDGIGISKDGTKIYVTNTKDGTISVIRLADKSARIIQTGGKPELIHANHDHSLLFISNFFENKVHVLDTETDQIVHEITGLDGPEEAVLSPAGNRLYVVNFNISRVYVYDASTYQKLNREYTVGKKPIGIELLSQSRKLYVTSYGDNSVSVITTSSERSE